MRKSTAGAALVTLAFVPARGLAQEAAAPAPVPSTAAPASGEAEKEFGNPGTLNIGAETGFDLSYTSSSPPQGSATNVVNFSVSPNVAYFVIEGLSIGAAVDFIYQKETGHEAETSFGIGPVVGYNVWLDRGLLSLWPQVEPIVFQTDSGGESTAIAAPTPTHTRLSGAVSVPLLIHPTSHFHVGVGPYFRIDYSSKQSAAGTSADAGKLTSFGILAEIAGWL